MSSSNIPVRRVSGRQLDLLWEFLNSHRDVAVAYNRSLQAKEYSKRKWRECAEIINAEGEGAFKDWKGWSKYWVDLKAKLKKRVAALRSSQSRTGGGPSTEAPLTEIETKFLQILGEDYGQGLAGVRVEPFIQPSQSTVENSNSGLQLEPDLIVMEIVENELNEAAAALPPQRIPTPPPPPTQRIPTPPPPPTQRQRRRQRQNAPMSQEEARRALVLSAQQRVDAADRSAQALETIGQSLIDIQRTLQSIERTINAAFPRVAP